MQSMTAVAFAAMLAVGATACGGGPDPAPGSVAPAGQESKDPASAEQQMSDESGKDAGSGDIDKDTMAMAIGSALSAEARWEGETLHVKLAEDQDVNGIRAFTNCMVTDQLLEDSQTAVMEFTDGTVACIDILEK
ncbi:hypothetical protein ART_1985 [Arthrobacter sp. PAMC 25486]|nr:hypothetical protein ART_1985 [Arthrobacter sp. PAMC 25486]